MSSSCPFQGDQSRPINTATHECGHADDNLSGDARVTYPEVHSRKVGKVRWRYLALQGPIAACGRSTPTTPNHQSTPTTPTTPSTAIRPVQLHLQPVLTTLICIYNPILFIISLYVYNYISVFIVYLLVQAFHLRPVVLLFKLVILPWGFILGRGWPIGRQSVEDSDPVVH